MFGYCTLPSVSLEIQSCATSSSSSRDKRTRERHSCCLERFWIRRGSRTDCSKPYILPWERTRMEEREGVYELGRLLSSLFCRGILPEPADVPGRRAASSHPAFSRIRARGSDSR